MQEDSTVNSTTSRNDEYCHVVELQLSSSSSEEEEDDDDEEEEENDARRPRPRLLMPVFMPVLNTCQASLLEPSMRMVSGYLYRYNLNNIPLPSAYRPLTDR